MPHSKDLILILEKNEFQLLLWTATIFVLLLLNTFFKVLITAFGLRSQTHPIALHMTRMAVSSLSTHLPCNPGRSCAMVCPRTSHLLKKKNRKTRLVASVSLFCPEWHDSINSFHFRSRRRKKHVPPSFCTSLSTTRPCFCKLHISPPSLV